MNKGYIGFGSFFHTVDEKDIKEINLGFYKEAYKIFYTGRHAIRFILDELIEKHGVRKIWLPNYYCQHVTAWMMSIYDNIFFYDINPFDPKNSCNLEWNSFDDKRDVVLLNNFFGVYQYELPTQGNRPFIIEDHSHGWGSLACLESKADFCVSSLRKTLPIPLGGIAWVPKNSRSIIDFDESNKSVAYQQINDFENFAWKPIEKAMELKSRCNDESIKSQYLEMFSNGEEYLHNQFEVIPVKMNHLDVVERFLKRDYMYYKAKNLTQVQSELCSSKPYKLLRNDKGTGFGLELLFVEREDFDRLKKYLISKKIYPSELWPNNKIKTKYKYLMNIHVDFRYNHEDINYIIDSLKKYQN